MNHVFSLLLSSYLFRGVFCKCKHLLCAQFAVKIGLHRVHAKSWRLFSLAFPCELKFNLSLVLLAVAAGLVCTVGGRGKEREGDIGHQKGTALVAKQA